jgi:hypothetical protein
MVQYVVTRQGSGYLVESITEHGRRKPIVKCATEREAVEYRRTLQNKADAAEILSAVPPRLTVNDHEKWGAPSRLSEGSARPSGCGDSRDAGRATRIMRRRKFAVQE